MSPITEEILKLIGEYDETPYQINSGQCEQFASELLFRLADKGIKGELWEANPEGKPNYPPTHAWVKVNGIFYDAEAPQGVPSWRALPIMLQAFRRWPQKRFKRSEIYNHGVIWDNGGRYAKRPVYRR